MSLLSIWFPLLSKTLITLNSISTGSEKYTITSETPVGAFDDKSGMVSSVNGCADTNGIDETDNTSKTMRIFFHLLIYS